jgi:DNA-binding response OmpR family regulator
MSENPVIDTAGCEKVSKTRILVVDDDDRIRRFVRLNLTLSGYDVTEAASGEEAIKQLETDKPDMMLLDMLMPVMDGFQVLKRLRAVSGLPVIAFSAHTFAAEEALCLGANDFLGKPFNPDELLSRIKRLLGRSRG